ncbi:phosphatidylinositol 4-phosphate 5-kinase-like protein 1 [Sardina pilchardus]|uniref:phosphatidylinositol 4-phosphate 5-kinase-like protein 1 n=1 Tax=Sardina pilchardus TaxID=27697 RepID=UPI002E0EAAA5
MERPKKQKKQRRSGTVGRRLWARLTRRWRLLGLFEIGEDHEFYSLTAMMREGLSAALESAPEQPTQTELTEEDYNKEECQVHEGFEMQTFAGAVFASLRRALGISEQEYQASLSTDGYLQFISNSKSKADFFLTNDKCYFLKTQNKREVKFLLSNLRKYMEHLEKYPHSLMVRFLGVHRIIIHGDVKKYFIVMQSVFYPDERITARYDVKGCEVGRWTNPPAGDTQRIVVLKDMNFEGQHINLGEHRSWLVRQVQLDSEFLHSLNVLDYSVLLAHQPLHRDEMDQNHHLATLVLRTTISVDIDTDATEHEPPKIPSTVLEEDAALLQSDPSGSPARTLAEPAQTLAEPARTLAEPARTLAEPAQTLAEPAQTLAEPAQTLAEPAQTLAEPAQTLAEPAQTLAEDPVSGIPLQELPHRHSAELQEFHEQNRRLLPDFKNPVHVVDGPELRYFVGVVDVFTVYGLKKRLENLWKRIRFPGRAFSTVSPTAYAQRFSQWVQNHTK